jgi:DNA topoisomerase-1
VPKTLVIVESPNKAKKLAAFLGRDYVVKASFGHVADLPAKDYGVDLATLEESYVVRDAKVVKQLREVIAGGGFDRVLLASDPDREGEAIAWHLARQLKVGGRAQRDAVRIEFREITAAAIRTAVSRPRPIDAARVDAQRSRRVLDRIVGFDCSKEICWPAARSRPGAARRRRCTSSASASARSSPSRPHLLDARGGVRRGAGGVRPRGAEGRRRAAPAEPEEGDADGRERKGRLVPRQFATREEAEALLAAARATRTSCATCRRGAPSAARRRRTPPRRCSRTPAASCA